MAKGEPKAVMRQKRAKITLCGGWEVLWEVRRNFLEERLLKIDSEGYVALTARVRALHVRRFLSGEGHMRGKTQGAISEEPVMAGAKTPPRKVVGSKNPSLWCIGGGMLSATEPPGQGLQPLTASGPLHMCC